MSKVGMQLGFKPGQRCFGGGEENENRKII